MYRKILYPTKIPYKILYPTNSIYWNRKVRINRGQDKREYLVIMRDNFVKSG